MDVVTQIGDNLTGGLVTSLTQDAESIKTKRNEWKGSFDESNRSFMEQLTQGVLLDPDIKTNVVLDLSYYAQVANVPAIQIQENGVVETDIGTFPINGKIVKPTQNTMQITFINTKLPLMERIFYPWLRETTMPFWVYADQPYTTADITIDFSKHMDIQYVFVGARPSNIETVQPSNELGTPTRQVTFMFDYFFITSKDSKSIQTGLEALASMGTQLLNSAGGMLGL